MSQCIPHIASPAPDPDPVASSRVICYLVDNTIDLSGNMTGHWIGHTTSGDAIDLGITATEYTPCVTNSHDCCFCLVCLSIGIPASLVVITGATGDPGPRGDTGANGTAGAAPVGVTGAIGVTGTA
jgi:hypothetical protein